jgi:hypothetical protein
MLGLTTDAFSHTVTLAPHVPYSWSHFTVEHVTAGACVISATYHRSADAIDLGIQGSGTGPCTLRFLPAISPTAKATRVELNGKAVAFHLESNSVDQHLSVSVPVVAGNSLLKIRLRRDFGLFLDSQLPALGSPSEGLRFVSESWTPNSLVLDLSGRAGRTYELGVWNAGQIISVKGATLETSSGEPRLMVSFPGGQDYVHLQLAIQFRQ